MYYEEKSEQMDRNDCCSMQYAAFPGYDRLCRGWNADVIGSCRQCRRGDCDDHPDRWRRTADRRCNCYADL